MKKNINWVIIEPWNIYQKFTHTFKNNIKENPIGLWDKMFNMYKKKYRLIEYEDWLNYDRVITVYLVFSSFFHNVSVLKKS